MIVWEAPGPYRIGFSSRTGGVSEGDFASANLGASDDDPAAITENRRRACASLDLDHERLAVNHQVHGATVIHARAGAAGEDGDALWTDEPELPLLALSADCVPIAIVSTGDRAALAVVHAGWRGLAAGIVKATVDAFAGAPTAAMIGPSIGPCCYEVGSEVSARFAPALTRGGMFDLWEAAAGMLRLAGVGRVERLDICTCCDPHTYFSHRRSPSGRHGLQGVLGALER